MFLLINKPKGMTSHDVIDRVRKVTDERRVGHAGTLDPNATGLLIVGVTRSGTKQLGILLKDTTKTYEAEIILGEERETDDVEGAKREVSYEKRLERPQEEEIISVLESFVGSQKQIPPAYSAIKIKGKKSYELARRGKEVKLKEREIYVHSARFVSYSYPELVVSFTVSSGTYIRSLARDIGRELKTGAYLGNLKRECIGDVCLNEAVDLDKLNNENWQDYVKTEI